MSDPDTTTFKMKPAIPATSNVGQDIEKDAEQHADREANSTDTPAPAAPPKGGWAAWSQVVAGHIFYGVSWGYGTAFAAFQLYYTSSSSSSASASQISWIGSLQLSLYFALSPLSGRLADLGHTRPLAALGSLLVVAGMLATSFAPARYYWAQLLAQGALNGLGGGLLSLPAAAAVGRAFAGSGRRTTAMALVAAGNSSGAVAYAALVTYAAPGRLGFAWTVRAAAAGTAALCAVAAALLRGPDRKQPTGGSGTGRPRTTATATAAFVDWSAFRAPAFVLFAAGSALVYAGAFAQMFYLGAFAREVAGVRGPRSIDLVLVANAAAAAARPLCGHAADAWVGPVTAWGANAAALGAVGLAWPAVGTAGRAALHGYAAALGFANGAALGVLPGAAASLARDPAKLGAWVGMTYALVGLGTLAGPPVFGAIVAAAGGGSRGYAYAQVWAGLTIMLGGGLVLAAAWLVGVRGRGKVWCKT
ncbi:MFS general substrate transporter [Xylariomycetidae sp. FL0641]|nr:MFS general substrate transporter [Xylariomycetidae sp. FL0641]